MFSKLTIFGAWTLDNYSCPSMPSASNRYCACVLCMQDFTFPLGFSMGTTPASVSCRTDLSCATSSPPSANSCSPCTSEWWEWLLEGLPVSKDGPPFGWFSLADGELLLGAVPPQLLGSSPCSSPHSTSASSSSLSWPLAWFACIQSFTYVNIKTQSLVCNVLATKASPCNVLATPLMQYFAVTSHLA